METPKYLFKSRWPKLTVTLPKVLVQFRNYTYSTNDDKVAEQLRGRRNVWEIPNTTAVEPEQKPAVIHGRATTANVGNVPPEPERERPTRGRGRPKRGSK
jgi:hypothetical protein